MPSGHDLDLKRRYRRPGAFVGRPERRRRRSRRRGMAALIVVIVALLVVGVMSRILGPTEHEPAGQSAPAYQ